jgi:hypothetical protein
MKRKFFFWGVALTVAGWLFFRLSVFKVLPGLHSATDLRQFWEGMTVSQKLIATGLELPFFAGLLCLLVSLCLAVLKK